MNSDLTVFSISVIEMAFPRVWWWAVIVSLGAIVAGGLVTCPTSGGTGLSELTLTSTNVMSHQVGPNGGDPPSLCPAVTTGCSYCR